MTAPVPIDVTADKRFGSRIALVGATLRVRRGTVHAVVGENGAGKSTLLKIVFGLVRADRGALAIDGTAVELARHTPARARERGIGMVQQHGVLVPSLSVVENSVLGREGGPVLALAGPARRLAERGAEIGLALDPWAVVETLPVAVRQRAEIVGELVGGAEILILDEPTAVLAPVEVDGLFATLRRLRAAGNTIVLVTHKLDEVRAIADDITVLRRGRTVATFAGDAPVAEIARAIVGGEPPVVGAAPAAAGEQVVLSVTGLAAGDRLRGVDLELRAGEIVGVAGVEGNGQTELAEAIAGLAGHGRVSIGGVDASSATVAARQALGLGHIPEDRQHRGLVLDASVADNLMLGRRDLAAGFWRRRDVELAAAHAAIAAFDIRPAEPAAKAGGLSGGNQQKVVVARELGRPGLVAVVAAQPTRGVDLGALALIHARLRAVAAAGAGVLLISADLDELMALSHRVVVMYRGQLVGEVRRGEVGARERVGVMMIGGAASASASAPASAAAAATATAAAAGTAPAAAAAAGTAPAAAAAAAAGTGAAAGAAPAPAAAAATLTEPLIEAPTPRFRELEIAAVAALLVLALGSLLILAFGQSPLRVWGAMVSRTVSDPYAIGQMLDAATGLCFTGLAVALALDAGLFNIGVEGQMVVGTVACAVTGSALPPGTPAVLAIPACVLAAAAGGAALGALTGALRAYRGAHEVITGIMLNAIVGGTVLWLGNAVLFQSGSTRAVPIVHGAELPPLGLGGSSASAAVIIAAAAVAGLWALRARSRWGPRWRAVGASASAAETLGIPVRRVQVAVMAASGALAGLAATGLVLGHEHAFEEGLGRGLGYFGVAVGLLGRSHPVGVAIAAVMVGFLSQGGLLVADMVPKELTELLLGLAVVAVAVAAPLVTRFTRQPR